MARLKMYYSSNRNISFDNSNNPDVEELPYDWDDWDPKDQEDYVSDALVDWMHDLVEVWAEVEDE